MLISVISLCRHTKHYYWYLHNERYHTDHCGGRDGSEGRSGLECLLWVGSVSVFSKAFPDPPPPAVAPLSGTIELWGRVWDWEGVRLRTQTG